MEKPESPEELKNLLISLLKEGKTKSEIANNFNVSEGTIYNWFKKFGIKVKDYLEFRLSYNVHVFDTVDSEEKAYWLGFLYADGWVSYLAIKNSYRIGLALNSIDIEHLRKFKAFLQDSRDDSAIKIYKYGPNGNKIHEGCRYVVCNEHLAKELINLGCTFRKSLTLTFPDIKKFNNPDFIFDFIRGYMDGDGCLSRTILKSGKLYPRLEIVGTNDFLTGVIKYLPQFGNVHAINNERLFRANAYGKKAREIANKLYGHATIYLDRKYEIFKALFEYKDGEIRNNGE